MELREVKTKLNAGDYDGILAQQLGLGSAKLLSYRERMINVILNYQSLFSGNEAALFSAPGRTELLGNHTDHQNGRVLAASVNLDIIACAAPNQTNTIRIQSEGYPLNTIDLDELSPREDELNTTAALIRGVAAGIHERGYEVGGFDCYMTSEVLSGSGLSSSAAYETAIGVILNHFFCDGKLSAVEIAKIGQYAENKFFGKPCGLMDQMASSVGSIIAIDFKEEGNPKITQIVCDFNAAGYSLCIIDTRTDHADLTADYAAIPAEMKDVASFFGKNILGEVKESAFMNAIPSLREEKGDRAVLRALHYYAENKRVDAAVEALKNQDFDAYFKISRDSGNSSGMFLQNVHTDKDPKQQGMSVALAVAQKLLGGEGSLRVHGGGFAGTIQAFVPNEKLEEFKNGMEAVLGKGACHILNIRPVGGTVLIP